jgi:hypothetical protein
MVFMYPSSSPVQSIVCFAKGTGHVGFQIKYVVYGLYYIYTEVPTSYSLELEGLESISPPEVEYVVPISSFLTLDRLIPYSLANFVASRSFSLRRPLTFC